MKEIILFILYITIFLCAMAILRNGLMNLTGGSLRNKIQKVTSSPIRSFFTGMVFTAILQSSSAVMVMTVGLVSVGGLSFVQSIGIILGSNIGTTVTAEFMTFSMTGWIFPGIIVGLICMLTEKKGLSAIGCSILGLFLIFFAIEGFKSLAAPLAEYTAFSMILGTIEHNLLIAVFTGALLAGIIHSGTATIGIAMGFIAGGQLSVDAGIALMLGSNIGTCVTGYIAAIGSTQEAKLTAYAHIWLNVFGVLLFYPFIEQLQAAAAFFTEVRHIQLAHASVIFNVICSLLVLPFTKQFAHFVLWLHKERRQD
ncbi:MAG: Na/Pi symporter [Bacillus sp. (in: firmicutes)]